MSERESDPACLRVPPLWPDEIPALRAEIAALKHDIERQIAESESEAMTTVLNLCMEQFPECRAYGDLPGWIADRNSENARLLDVIAAMSKQQKIVGASETTPYRFESAAQQAGRSSVKHPDDTSGSALQASGTPAAPADTEPAYIIWFDDASVAPEVFAGHGATDAAHKRYEQISARWNAHLFAKVNSNSRDANERSAESAASAEPALYAYLGADGEVQWGVEVTK